MSLESVLFIRIICVWVIRRSRLDLNLNYQTAVYKVSLVFSIIVLSYFKVGMGITAREASHILLGIENPPISKILNR